MSTKKDWEDLPDDPELAFLVLEERLWAQVVEVRTPKTEFDTVEQPDPRIVGQTEHSYVENIKGYIDETGIDINIDVEFLDGYWDENFSIFQSTITRPRQDGIFCEARRNGDPLGRL